jgi:hypothetical protein
MKLVAVEWVDSSHGSHWKDLEALPKMNRACWCKSVGWIACEDEDAITLVSHVDFAETQGNADMCIPRVAIKKIRRLPDPWRKKR